MAPFLLGEAATNLSTPPIYDLYATVNHYGSVYIGHYMATAKPPMESNNTGNVQYVLCGFCHVGAHEKYASHGLMVFVLFWGQLILAQYMNVNECSVFSS